MQKRREISKDYNLKACFPKVASEWHPTLNKGVVPSQVYPNSRMKYWFMCGKGHEFYAEVSKRTRKKAPTSCPFCVGKKVSDDNCLATTHPHLKEEWDFKRNANQELTPYNVTKGSNKRVYWICSHCNSSFYSMIAKRALRNQGCKKCGSGTSFPEQFLCYCLEQILGKEDIINRVNLEGYEIDIFIRSSNVAIEYCGRAFHKKSNKDKDKIRFLESKGIKVIQIRETGCPNLDIPCFSVIVSEYTNTKKEKLQDVLEKVLEDLTVIWNELMGYREAKKLIDKANVFLDQLDMKAISSTIFSRIRLSRKPLIPFFKERPDLLRIWNHEKNTHVQPYELSKCSTIEVHWKCSKGHEWRDSILSQVQRKTLCRKCEHPTLNETYPNISLELDDPVYSAEQLSFGSEKVVKWKCKDCKKPYYMPVYQKVNGKICPHCFVSNFSLAATHPHLLEQWHKSKNAITPEQVTWGSGKRIHWICSCGNEWITAINKRTRRNPTRCPSCKKI